MQRESVCGSGVMKCQVQLYLFWQYISPNYACPSWHEEVRNRAQIKLLQSQLRPLHIFTFLQYRFNKIIAQHAARSSKESDFFLFGRCRDQIPEVKPTILRDIFYGCPQSLQSNAGTVTQIWSRPLPSAPVVQSLHITEANGNCC